MDKIVKRNRKNLAKRQVFLLYGVVEVNRDPFDYALVGYAQDDGYALSDFVILSGAIA